MPGFWDDHQKAQGLMQRLAEMRRQVETWRPLEAKIKELEDLLQLAKADGDQQIAAEVAEAAIEISEQVDGLELRLSLSGPYDQRDAILAVHAGAGGTDSMDWAEILLRMYSRWVEKEDFQGDILDLAQGEEAGLKSATLEVKGDYAYGYLKAERGVSPFDSSHARHTSFALVEVMPEAESEAEVKIEPDDLRIDVFRASSKGGQNVQKNATAVRITHMPTGLVVSCQNERSQHRNRDIALKVLEARLLEKELARKAAKQARLKGEHVTAAWGNQIRSYVLHPYKMVKDHRSGFETSDVQAVLDGQIDGLLQAYQKSTLGE